MARLNLLGDTRGSKEAYRSWRRPPQWQGNKRCCLPLAAPLVDPHHTGFETGQNVYMMKSMAGFGEICPPGRPCLRPDDEHLKRRQSPSKGLLIGRELKPNTAVCPARRWFPAVGLTGAGPQCRFG
jgi:hypothetical protein